MITVSARCPYCNDTISQRLEPGRRVVCPACGQTFTDNCPDLDDASQPARCVTCPSTELFVRKDFPQRLGVAIVVAGFAASSVAWYHHLVFWTFGILFFTALIDVLLYLIMGNVLECYRCHAQYRGLSALTGHAGFDLEIHERYRQQAARAGSGGAIRSESR